MEIIADIDKAHIIFNNVAKIAETAYFKFISVINKSRITKHNISKKTYVKFANKSTGTTIKNIFPMNYLANILKQITKYVYRLFVGSARNLLSASLFNYIITGNMVAMIYYDEENS